MERHHDAHDLGRVSRSGGRFVTSCRFEPGRSCASRLRPRASREALLEKTNAGCFSSSTALFSAGRMASKPTEPSAAGVPAPTIAGVPDVATQPDEPLPDPAVPEGEDLLRALAHAQRVVEQQSTIVPEEPPPNEEPAPNVPPAIAAHAATGDHAAAPPHTTVVVQAPVLAAPPDPPADTSKWITANEAHTRIRSCSHPKVLDFVEQLLIERDKDEGDRKQALERKAVNLIGATALAVSASALLGVQARSLVESLDVLFGASIVLLVLALGGALVAIAGALALRTLSTATHSDNIVLNNIALHRLSSFDQASADEDVTAELINFRHVVVCNRWTVVDSARRNNDSRAWWISIGQWLSVSFVFVLGVALALLWLGSAGLASTNSEVPNEQRETTELDTRGRTEGDADQVGADPPADSRDSEEEPEPQTTPIDTDERQETREPGPEP